MWLCPLSSRLCAHAYTSENCLTLLSAWIAIKYINVFEYDINVGQKIKIK